MAVAGEPGVAEGLLARLRPLLEPPAEVRYAEAERVPDVPSPAWSSACSSSGSAARASRSSSSTAGSSVELRAVPRRRRRGRVPLRPRRRPPRARSAARSAIAAARCGSAPRARARSSSRWTSSRAAGSARAPARAAVPAARSSPRQSARRPAAASRSPARSASSASRLAELGLVPSRLLEVVAEELVQLDEVGAALLQPAAKRSCSSARVALGARRRRRRGSAGGGSGRRPRPGSRGLSGRIELLADERGQARRQVRLLGASAWTAPRWKTSPSTAPARARTLRPFELVESCGEQRLQAGRDSDLALGLSGHRDHLGRRTAGCRRRRGRSARAARRASSRGISASTSSSASGSSRSATGHCGRRSSELRPRHAEEQDRRAGESSATLLDQVEERLLAPLDVVEDADERRACSSSSLRKAQAISSADVPSSRLAEQRAERGRGSRIGGKRVQLLQHLDHRPVGDPLAVGEAAAARRSRASTAARNSAASRDLPTPGSPTTVTSSQRRSSSARCQASAERSQLASPADERRLVPRARALRAPRRAGRPAPAPPSPSARAARPARSRPRRCTSASVSSPIRISPGCAACSSRAATLTASPVASRSSVPVTTSPVLTPIRRLRRRARAGRRASPPPPGRPAARRPRAPAGTPNTAMTASPMNFSTVPPCDSTIPFIRSK